MTPLEQRIAEVMSTIEEACANIKAARESLDALAARGVTEPVSDS